MQSKCTNEAQGYYVLNTDLYTEEGLLENLYNVRTGVNPVLLLHVLLY